MTKYRQNIVEPNKMKEKKDLRFTTLSTEGFLKAMRQETYNNGSSPILGKSV